MNRFTEKYHHCEKPKSPQKQVTYLHAPHQPPITNILRRMILVLNRVMDKPTAQALKKPIYNLLH